MNTPTPTRLIRLIGWNGCSLTQALGVRIVVACERRAGIGQSGSAQADTTDPQVFGIPMADTVFGVDDAMCGGDVVPFGGEVFEDSACAAGPTPRRGIPFSYDLSRELTITNLGPNAVFLE